GQTEVMARGYYKLEGNNEVCDGAKISFYTDDAYENLHATVVADEQGKATLKLTAEEAKTFNDGSGRFNFYSRLEEDDRFKEQESDVSVLDAALDVKLFIEDSTKRIKATLMVFDADSSKLVVASEKPLQFVIVRALSMLPVTEEMSFTDEEGVVEVEFPDDVPGDEHGNLTVMVRLEEDDDHGTVAYSQSIDWGIPMVQHHTDERSLAGNQKNAPLVIVITITCTLAAVWGYIFYVVYGLFGIKKSAKGVA
ncbi:MAG: hypothetical protein K9J06_11855, partial [Flavobacteriales bacterium]|nr:hypothetical protein [Flavobacteriales bacterium]